MTVSSSAGFLPPAAFGAAPGPDRLYTCPRCSQQMQVAGNGLTACVACGWRGEVYAFNPLPFTVENAEQALPEDATCLHHPTKRATAVCAGTGDYICALCAVELEGQTYSANYLSTAGKATIGKAFERYLERPDNAIITYMALTLIPPVTYIMLPGIVIWLPYSIYLYVKCLRMRETNPLFARVMSKTRVVMIPIFLGLYGLGFVILAVLLFIGIFVSRR